MISLSLILIQTYMIVSVADVYIIEWFTGLGGGLRSLGAILELSCFASPCLFEDQHRGSPALQLPLILYLLLLPLSFL